MTTAPRTGDQSGNADSDFAGAWDQVRGDEAIQFQPWDKSPVKPGMPPEWLTSLLEWLGNLLEPVAANWPIVKWTLIALAAIVLAWIAWRLLWPAVQRWRSRDDLGTPQDILPDAQQAQVLLSEAEALAGRGAYDEAVHLLLMRSVEDISLARPDLVHPSSTTREIGTLDALGQRTHTCFATIGQLVEASRFAGQPLGAGDWEASRKAYGEFAGLKLA